MEGDVVIAELCDGLLVPFAQEAVKIKKQASVNNKKRFFIL